MEDLRLTNEQLFDKYEKVCISPVALKDKLASLTNTSIHLLH